MTSEFKSIYGVDTETGSMYYTAPSDTLIILIKLFNRDSVNAQSGYLSVFDAAETTEMYTVFPTTVVDPLGKLVDNNKHIVPAGCKVYIEGGTASQIEYELTVIEGINT